jgi:sortase A
VRRRRRERGSTQTVKKGTLFVEVASSHRTSITLVALLGIGLAAVVRPKSKEPKRERPLPLESWVDVDLPPSPPPPDPAPKQKPKGRARRRLGKILIGLGVVLVTYSAAIIFWGDPATALYANWKQHELDGQLDDTFASYASTVDLTPPPRADERPLTGQELADYQRQRVAVAANKLNDSLRMGKALGRITVPRIDVNAIFVQGTRWGPDLSQGPGHYRQTSLPGVGRTMAIAAHRTTFGAWFRHINDLKAGDSVALKLPYATFHYQVFGHKIVDNGNWSVIRDRGFDALVLSACHPLYSASERWIVFAALYRVDPVKGTPYLVDRRNRVRPLDS